ncbi:MAG: FAD-dependent oxidoreductase [Hyphomonadaceae bacterium]|nr:FAD-dependent oxidoreductase [Hyphomonadaceae bacterium]
MAHTPLFGALQRALRETGAPFGPRALSRRSFLVMGAALGAATAAGCTRGAAAANIAIIGAGAAGLTAAYRLAQAGRSVTLYEASERLGGRMFTRRDFNAAGQFCELGGELVDSNHTALQALARELGVNVTPLAAENAAGEDLYQIAGRRYRQRDLADQDGRGAVVRLAARIAEDQNALLDGDENWTDRARALDATSLQAYLASLNNMAPAWVMQLMDIAYAGEFGIPTAEQSALNLVDFIGTDTSSGFAMFGDSDETMRIEGGSSALTDALAARLGERVRIARQHALTAAAREGENVRLSFTASDGTIERTHSHVIFALPFTKLRGVAGLEALGLEDVKLQAIRELGYGDNAKLMISTQSRPWLGEGMTGALYSDRAQVIWETSRGQAGDQGVLTNFLTGQRDRAAALAAMTAGLNALTPAAARSLDPNVAAWMDWQRQPFALGSYAGAKVGQYTTLLEETGTPSTDGRIQFAGEHTSVDFIGFMNGAVESGERAAAALLG